MLLICRCKQMGLYVKKLFAIVALNCIFVGCLYSQPKKEIFEGKVINVTDKNNLRQGMWVYFFDTLHTKPSCKGIFVDGKKHGVWCTYFRNGNLQDQFTYVNDKPIGEAKVYYENGNIQEEGYWNLKFWVGEYRRYYESGKVNYVWQFDQNGNRTGSQEYYYENGKLKAKGNWVEGNKQGSVMEYYVSGKLRAESQWKDNNVHGVAKEYYESGALKSELAYNNGVYDNLTSKTYRDREPDKNPAKTEITPPIDNTVIPTEPTNPVVLETNDAPEKFSGNGYYRLMHDNKIDREGQFVGGILMDGKRYYYNQSGVLIRIAYYEHGRIVKTEDME